MTERVGGGRIRDKQTNRQAESRDSDRETFMLAEEAGKWDGERFIKSDGGRGELYHKFLTDEAVETVW